MGYTTRPIRSMFKMTQIEFAARFGVSLATVKNWDSRECMPSYFEHLLMDYYILSKEHEETKQELEKMQSKYKEAFDESFKYATMCGLRDSKIQLLKEELKKYVDIKE